MTVVVVEERRREWRSGGMNGRVEERIEEWAPTRSPHTTAHVVLGSIE